MASPSSSGQIEQVDLDAATAACKAAYVRVLEFRANSNLRNSLEDSQDVAKLDWDDVCVEGLLGVGGFSCVSKVSVPILEVDDGDQNGTSERKSAISCSSNSSHQERMYALKCLNEKTTSDKKSFVLGAADLANEFLLLSNLKHENVVQIYGVSQTCVSQAFEDDGGYFLLLELLRGTLADLLRLWRDDLELSTRDGIPSCLDRLEGIALGVASAMKYVHSKRIIFRDLKPKNIGFDGHGRPKIFDFGLAREVPDDSTTLNLTVRGIAGSFRYMSPECAMGRGCVFESDVFSYGLVLCEMLCLEKPRANLRDSDDFLQRIAKGSIKPNTSTIPSQSLKDLLNECWQMDPGERPSFERVCSLIEMELRTNKKQLQQVQRMSWRQQISVLKKATRVRLLERRRSANRKYSYDQA